MRKSIHTVDTQTEQESQPHDTSFIFTTGIRYLFTLYIASVLLHKNGQNKAPAVVFAFCHIISDLVISVLNLPTGDRPRR